MFIHPYLAGQRHRDLIAAAETSRLASSARKGRKARPRPRRATHPATPAGPLRAPAPSA